MLGPFSPLGQLQSGQNLLVNLARHPHVATRGQLQAACNCKLDDRVSRSPWSLLWHKRSIMIRRCRAIAHHHAALVTAYCRHRCDCITRVSLNLRRNTSTALLHACRMYMLQCHVVSASIWQPQFADRTGKRNTGSTQQNTLPRVDHGVVQAGALLRTCGWRTTSWP